MELINLQNSGTYFLVFFQLYQRNNTYKLHSYAKGFNRINYAVLLNILSTRTYQTSEYQQTACMFIKIFSAIKKTQ